MSYIAHESILKAPHRFGLNATFISTIAESAKLIEVLSEAINGKRTKEQEFEMIKALARHQILVSQIVFFMDIKSIVDKQIQLELTVLTDRVLTPPAKKQRGER